MGHRSLEGPTATRRTRVAVLPYSSLVAIPPHRKSDDNATALF